MRQNKVQLVQLCIVYTDISILSLLFNPFRAMGVVVGSAVRFTHGYLYIMPSGLFDIRTGFIEIEFFWDGCFSVLTGLKVNNHR